MKMPVQPILLLDTFHRMHYSSIFSLTPGITRAVFLPEISTNEFQMDDVDLLKQKVYSIMEDGLIRYRAPWIKGNE